MSFVQGIPNEVVGETVVGEEVGELGTEVTGEGIGEDGTEITGEGIGEDGTEVILVTGEGVANIVTVYQEKLVLAYFKAEY